MNIVVAAIVTPPAAAIDAATHSIPSPQSDGSWIWTYTFVDGEKEVVLRLRGLPQDDGVVWQMFVTALSEDPPLDKALWFEGIARSADDGEWILRDLAQTDHPEVLKIEWEVTADNDRFLTFTNINPASNEFDDSLAYSDVDALGSIVYHDASEGADLEIRWDQTTGAGSLRAPDYRNGERSCWDEHQDDVICAE
jgi:hypothetical protein